MTRLIKGLSTVSASSVLGLLVAASPLRVEAAMTEVPVVLDDQTTIVAYSQSTKGEAVVRARVIEADRSTRKACMTTDGKGLFRAGDRLYISDYYLAWFDYTSQDGVIFGPPYDPAPWERSGALAGWWTLDAATGDFKYLKSVPGGCERWAPNELIPGSASISGGQFWWDKHAPAQEFAIRVCKPPICECDPATALPRCYMAHHYARNTPASQWQAPAPFEAADGVHFKTTERMASHPPSFVDISDGDDATVSEYIESEVDYICKPDALVAVWRFRPVVSTPTMAADPLLAFVWTSYAQEVDDEVCDLTPPGDLWPDEGDVHTRPLWLRSSHVLDRSYDGGGPFQPGTTLEIKLGPVCTNDNWTIFSRDGQHVSDGSFLRLGQHGALSSAERRFEFRSIGPAGQGAGTATDPEHVTWKNLILFNEVDDGTIGFGAVSQGTPTQLVNGRWYVAKFELSTGFAVSSSGCPPPAPTLNGPEGSLNDPTPFFSWTAVGGQNATYDLRILRADGSVVVEETGLATTSYTPAAALPSGVPLEWEVRGVGGCGPGAFSLRKSFEILPPGPCPPPAPTALTPFGTITTPRPTYTWSAVAGATNGYTLFALDGDTIVHEGYNIVGTHWTPPPDQPDAPSGVPMRWKVKANCGTQSGPPSAEQQYMVASATCEPAWAPTPREPYGSIASARPTFRWDAVPGATRYKVLVQTGDAAGTVVATGDNVSGTTWTPTQDLPPDKLDKPLRWKVRVEGSCGTGRYSLNAYFYVRTAASPTVNITAPLQGATVSGPTPITVTATTTGAVNEVEFWVDGAWQAADTQPPFQFEWDTTRNPLRPAPQPLDIGYSFVEWIDPATFAASRAEVANYTDFYYATLASYDPAYPGDWLARLQTSLANAEAEGKDIHLNLELNRPEYAPLWQEVMGAAAAHWDRVVRIELAAEPNSWSRVQMEAWIQAVTTWITTHNLTLPPHGFGATSLYTQPVPDWKNAAGLSWVGIQGYLVPPGSATSQENVEQVTAQLLVGLADVPQSRKVVFVPMASDRDGTWTSITGVRDVQTAAHAVAMEYPRVIAINLFAYAVPGGTRTHVDLKTPHRLMADRLLGRPVPGAGNGPRTLMAKAFTADGKTAYSRIGVWALNPLFADVPPGHGAHTAVENVWNAGISEACGADAEGRALFCPNSHFARRRVARWLIKAKEGILYRPPAATGVFTDVSAEDAPWVEDAVNRQILIPRAPTLFEPLGTITRGEMARALLKALEGAAYTPPACVTPVFQDVPCELKIAAWVNEIYRRGITTGCATGLYCPNDVVWRWMAAIFVDRAF